jgi:hypothetical protein
MAQKRRKLQDKLFGSQRAFIFRHCSEWGLIDFHSNHFEPNHTDNNFKKGLRKRNVAPRLLKRPMRKTSSKDEIIFSLRLKISIWQQSSSKTLPPRMLPVMMKRTMKRMRTMDGSLMKTKMKAGMKTRMMMKRMMMMMMMAMMMMPWRWTNQMWMKRRMQRSQRS